MEPRDLIIWRAACWPSFKIIALLTVLLAPAVVSAEHTDQHRINKVKAAFVLNIARFVTWPAEVFDDGRVDAGRGYILLCYYRSNPFPGGLESITGKTVAGRRLAVKKIDRLSAAESCQLLLISQPELENFTKEVVPGRMKALLTIVDRTNEDTDSSASTDGSKGVMVSLVRKGSRIGFDIDFSMSRDAGLKISSQLLKHARIVGGGS